MNSLKNLKMKKLKDFLACEEAVKKTRIALEKKTEKDFIEVARAKQSVRERAHNKFLD